MKALVAQPGDDGGQELGGRRRQKKKHRAARRRFKRLQKRVLRLLRQLFRVVDHNGVPPALEGANGYAPDELAHRVHADGAPRRADKDVVGMGAAYHPLAGGALVAGLVRARAVHGAGADFRHRALARPRRAGKQVCVDKSSPGKVGAQPTQLLVKSKKLIEVQASPIRRSDFDELLDV